MFNAQSLRYRNGCFRMYRAAAMLSRSFENMGADRLADAVYALLPLRVCKIGYEVWSCSHSDDFEAFIDRKKL